MPDIKISYDEMREKVSMMRNHNTTLDRLLREIQDEIKRLEADWTSDSSDTVHTKITALTPKLDSYKEVIESYAKFLEDTIAQYTETESSLNTAASNRLI